MSVFLDNQVGAKPSEVRLLVVGYALSGALGLTSIGMSIYLRLVPDDDTYATAIGFIPAVLYAGAGQYLIRRALQTRDRNKRVALLTSLRAVLMLPIALAVMGLVVSVMLLIVFPPAIAPRSFLALTILSIAFSVIGVFLMPFAFAARNIRWLVNPA